MSTIGGNWKELFKAASEGDESLVRFHIGTGVDPNYQHPEFFTNPLFEAIRQGHLGVVKLLVTEGKASLTRFKEDLSGQTPLEVALEERQHDIVDYLNTVLPEDKRFPVRHVLVTGGESGIGKSICTRLLEQGHDVVFTCESEEQGEEVVDELRRKTRNSKIVYVVGDTSTIQGVRALGRTILDPKNGLASVLNVVVHSSSVRPRQKQINQDGLEMTFMRNYVAPYLLNEMLLPTLKRNGPSSRIVLVTAGSYKLGMADLDKTPYGDDFSHPTAYASSQQCSMFFMLNCARRLKGLGVTVNAVYPGVTTAEMEEGTWRCCGFLWDWLTGTSGKDPSEAAKIPCWLAVSSEVENKHGIYFEEWEEQEFSSTVLDVNMQRQWRQWTEDYLDGK